MSQTTDLQKKPQAADFLLPKKLQRPRNMLNDPLATWLTWGDLEAAWKEVASPSNTPLVAEFVSALWKESGYLPETHTLKRILTATVLLAGPACFPGSGEGPATPT